MVYFDSGSQVQVVDVQVHKLQHFLQHRNHFNVVSKIKCENETDYNSWMTTLHLTINPYIHSDQPKEEHIWTGFDGKKPSKRGLLSQWISIPRRAK